MHESILKFSLLLFTPFLFANPVPMECTPRSYADLQKAYRGSKKTLVFFASWCVECADSLKKNQGIDVLYISVFDEKKRAEAVAQKFNLKNCILDTDIAKNLNVIGVPMTKEVEFK